MKIVSATVVLPEAGHLGRYTLSDGAGGINLALEQHVGLQNNTFVRATFSGPVEYVVDGPRQLDVDIFRQVPGMTALVSNPITIQGTLYDCETCK